MSRSFDGKSLLCDAPGCTARTDAPVILNNVTGNTEGPLIPPARWLSVQRNGLSQHFCRTHTAAVLLDTPKPSPDLGAPILFRNVVLVMDSSALASTAMERAIELVAGQSGVDVTVIFMACGRCTPSLKSPPTGELLQQSPSDNYCPGTRSALNKIAGLLASRSVAYRLQVQTNSSIPRVMLQTANQGDTDILIVAAALSEDFLPTSPIPILIFSTADTKDCNYSDNNKQFD